MSSDPAQRGEYVKRERLTVEGMVQGVGFRPFVYRLARELGLAGFVKNTPAGVVIEIEGAGVLLETFKAALNRCGPPQARIFGLDTAPLAATGGPDFTIRPSEGGTDTAVPILPDLAVCADCLREMNDPADRRHRYPFINCTNCGPRFSIITALPYDRPNTTMVGFGMCDACHAEYRNPDARRHHAQPIACPDCGPQLVLLNARGNRRETREKALRMAAQAVRDEKILALKGLGGFHLICDARSEAAIAKLRRRKHRPLKPFAVMHPTLSGVRGDCVVAPQEEALLCAAEAPIVLLRKKSACSVPEGIAPGNPYLGVMLPYTPLHHLLMAELGFPVVATSGNRAGEPVCIDETAAVEALADIADVFLVHDRPISGRCDDSIVRVVKGRATVLRRARGYAPLPVRVNHHFAAPVLAVGGHQKNTLALALRDRVFLSPHIGDLDTPEACEAHRAARDLLCLLYGAEPAQTVCDLHPDYASRRMAERRGGDIGDIIAVQHHLAHALGCMADNGLDPPCLAVTWDGTGHGADGCVWGGEFLAIRPGGHERMMHFMPFPLPGGDAAACDPKRSALGMLYALEGDAAFRRDIALPGKSAGLIETALQKGINCPQSSSAGRIFDAVAALTGICMETTFEGQPAMALEFAADAGAAESYGFAIENSIIDWRPMLRAILDDMDAGLSASDISGKFHATLAAMIVAAAQRAGLGDILLTGGCFQNPLLLEMAVDALGAAGFKAHWHRQVPPNDGGLALGQVMALAHVL